MPKPFRRRKGKNGPYVGNYRANIDGRDVNLKTKDAHEAHARARLAAQGKWPPIPAAVDAALDALDPGRQNTDPPAPENLPENEHDSNAIAGDRRPASAGRPGEPSAATPIAEPEPESLHAAAAAAAAETAGEPEEKREQQAEQANGVNDELRSIMAELGGGASGSDLLDGICDGAAAFLLWAEAKGIQLGVNWTLSRRKIGKRLTTKVPEQGTLMRKSLKVGLKGALVTHFPDFATNLTPGWAIAIGLVGGAGQSVMQGELVDLKTGTHQVVADAVAEAKAEATAAADAPAEASPPSA